MGRRDGKQGAWKMPFKRCQKLTTASLFPEQALTHKLWAKEYLVSTNQADLTDISQHAMCGVSNELFKPGADPRRVVKLAEQLRSIANRRAEEGLIDEARVALKQVCFDLDL